MGYTVKQVAKLSGMTVRTLHFYDEVGLLKPAYHGANGYRFYEEKQLLLLQQILFFRELGFDLREINRLLKRKNFDVPAAFKEHRKKLEANLSRTQNLINTIDQTLEHMKGKRKMKAADLFVGFDAATQARHEEELVRKFGEDAREGIEASKKRVQAWTREDWERSGQRWSQICEGLVSQMKIKAAPNSEKVQLLVRDHYEWSKQFWTPNRESYRGHGAFLAESELREAYDRHDPRLAEFLAAAIAVFAERELI